MSDKNRRLVFGQLQYTKRPEHLFLLNNLLPLVLVRVSTLSCYKIGVILVSKAYASRTHFLDACIMVIPY